VWSANPKVGKSLDLKTFGTLRHVAPGFGMGRQPYLVQTLLESAGLAHQTAAILPSFSLVLEALTGTEHVAIVPRLLAESYARHLPLRILPCPVALPPMIEVLQWPTHLDRDPLLGWLREQLRESAEEIAQRTGRRKRPIARRPIPRKPHAGSAPSR